MTYEEFYREIDCNFPYQDETKWKQVIAQGHEIGLDAPFLVLHEICRKPFSVELDQESQMKIFEYWQSSFTHPLINILKPACLAHINNSRLSVDEVIQIMDEVKEFPKSHTALQIICFACEDDEGLVEAKYEEILDEWKPNNQIA